MLAVGYKFDRSFVARGDKIGVFRHTDDNKLEFDTTINNVGTPSGKGFKPLKMMLHNQDAQMVMMDPSNKHAVFNMDLEYGKIVDEWKVHDDVQVNNIVPNSKYAQMTTEKTMIGHSHNGIFRIDPRLSGNKLVDSQFKQYAAKNDFSVAATDNTGRLAVASNKGDIRLFDTIGKNAKTALPALGDPIIGVDVSTDGRYIIATCKTYLLLIDTLIGSGRYQGQLGFDRSFPADAKPQPKRLTLKPSHVAFMVVRSRSLQHASTLVPTQKHPSSPVQALTSSAGRLRKSRRARLARTCSNVTAARLSPTNTRTAQIRQLWWHSSTMYRWRRGVNC